MSKESKKSISLSDSIIKEGIVILPLKKWQRIVRALEDLEMYQSESLAKEIKKRREEKETVSLERILS